MAHIQPCFRKLGIDLGYYNGKEVYPRTINKRNIGLNLHNNHFCLIWKSESIKFIQAIKEMKDNFKLLIIT